MSSLAQAAFKLAYQLCPVFLTNGIATNMPGGALPIIALTQGQDFVFGLLTGSSDITNTDNYFANFEPLPGATLIDQQIATYPFANQTTAANAVITQPLTVSLLMKSPARAFPNGYVLKLATMTALQATLLQHNATGGTYTIATPSVFYTNCLMRAMADVSTGETKQTQVTWRMDFMQPLLTLQQAEQAQNNLMSKLTNGTQIQGQPSYTGVSPTVGQPDSLATPSIIPSSSGASGAGVAGSPFQ